MINKINKIIRETQRMTKEEKNKINKIIISLNLFLYNFLKFLALKHTAIILFN